MSFIPGTAVATTSSAPDATSRFEMRFMPWVSRYSTSAASGVRNRARTPGSRSVSSYPKPVAPNIAGSPDLPSTSTISTLRPARAAVTASAAVTVVFPTPPLPATITTWEVEQNSATSISACYESPDAIPRP